MENIESTLESLLTEFNSDIKRNSEYGKSKQELEERYNNIMKQYLDKFSSALEAFKLSSSSNQDYLYSQFQFFNKHFEKSVSEHGLESADSIINQNIIEFKRNVEVAAETSMTDEEKKDEISQNSRRKNSAVEYDKDSSETQDRKDTNRFENSIDEFSQDVIGHSLRVTSGYLSQREYMLKAVAMEANATALREYMRKLNKSMVQAYGEALLAHTSSIYEYYGEQDPNYLAEILKAAEKIADIEKTSEEPKTTGYDPFAPVSEEIQEKLKKVSENARQFKDSPAPTAKKPDSKQLPTDFII